jgi:DNA-binding CsgD family transcriptional regulator
MNARGNLKQNETVSPETKTHTMSAVELLSTLGLSCLVGWMLLAFFCRPRVYAASDPHYVYNLEFLGTFLGVAAGYLILHKLGQQSSFNPFARGFVALALVCGLVLPALVFAQGYGIDISYIAICAVNLCTGFSFAVFFTAWLDVASRLHPRSLGYFIGLSFVGGAALLALAMLTGELVLPLLAGIELVCSTALLMFATANVEFNDTRAPLESVPDVWRFSRDVEPSFFMFGVVFACGFVRLFAFDESAVPLGLLSVLIGAFITVTVAGGHQRPSVVTAQRIVAFVLVACCVIMSFTPGEVQLFCTCIIIAAWATLTCFNSAFIVRKSILERANPCFREAPRRLAPLACGFFCGWAIATVVNVFFGSDAAVFSTVRLVLALVLLGVVIAFMPFEDRHEIDGNVKLDDATPVVVSVESTEAELFEARCAAVERHYQLSPREGEILRYLAKGRNSAFIQEKLVISQNTVKSHIARIYRKLDIHSQQKLMDFVEQFPLDLSNQNPKV